MKGRRFSLARYQRRALAAAAVACFSGAVALTPSEVRSRMHHQAAPHFEVRERRDALVIAVTPRNDPFVPRANDDDPHAGARVHVSSVPSIFAQLGPLPPNLGAATMLARLDGPASARVLAVVLGDRPTALVDDGGTPTMVQAGDRFGGTRVAGIDRDGVRLQDGRRLQLPAREGAAR